MFPSSSPLAYHGSSWPSVWHYSFAIRKTRAKISVPTPTSLTGFSWLSSVPPSRCQDNTSCYFRLVSWGEVRLSPLGTSATNWPIVPAPDGRWWWLWSSRWNENWQGKPKYSEKTCASAVLSTTNSTWPDLDLNPGSRGVKPATNRLSYGTALPQIRSRDIHILSRPFDTYIRSCWLCRKVNNLFICVLCDRHKLISERNLLLRNVFRVIRIIRLMFLCSSNRNRSYVRVLVSVLTRSSWRDCASKRFWHNVRYSSGSCFEGGGK
jgi:hypothetical protein